MTWKPPVLLVLITGLAGCSSTTGPVAAPEANAARAAGAPAPASSRDYVQRIPGTTIGIEMVWIPEGGFWIGRTEVTWDQFLVFCDFDRTRSEPPGVDAVSRPSKPLDVFPYHRDWGAGTRPAVGMSWNAAKQYCRWLSMNSGRTYRLPTEAEWVLACGPDPEDVPAHAWCAENSVNMTQEAGTRRPNAHGLHDMFGNLWEYCANPYDPADPDRAVLRGGSWRDRAGDITSTARLRFDNDWTLEDPNVPPGLWWVPDGDHLGFRILRPGGETALGDGGHDDTRQP
jgi:formylglycine-generating enzyme required for sulfatase activity